MSGQTLYGEHFATEDDIEQVKRLTDFEYNFFFFFSMGRRANSNTNHCIKFHHSLDMNAHILKFPIIMHSEFFLVLIIFQQLCLHISLIPWPQSCILTSTPWDGYISRRFVTVFLKSLLLSVGKIKHEDTPSGRHDNRRTTLIINILVKKNDFIYVINPWNKWKSF